MSEQPRKAAGLRAVGARLVRVYGVIFEMAWAAARGRAAGLFSLFVVLGVTGAVQAFISRPVLDALQQGNGSRALSFGILFLAISAVSTIANDGLTLLQNDMADRISHEVDRRLMRIAAGAPGLDHLERADFADRMKQVRERQWIPAQILQQMSSMAFVSFGMIAATAMLGSIHPILLLLPVVVIPSAVLQFRAYRRNWRLMEQATPEQRLADHYLKLATQPIGAKEIRLFGLRDHILGEHRRLGRSYVAKLFQARVRSATRSAIGGFLYGLSLTVAIGFIGWLALNGRATPGELGMGIMVTRLMLGHIEMAAELVAGLAEMAFMGDKYMWLLRYKPSIEVLSADRARPAPAAITHGITFEDVTFSYPQTDKRVLDGVSLFIPASATVAIVGENGAGKSSLVKLLARFYDPTGGRILIDGVDLRDIDLDGWRARVSTAFQDFVKFQFIAAETVGVGDLTRLDDRDRVGAAVTFAGGERIVRKLPSGLDTQLGRQFKDGHDLSEGEWQRFALARGSMRDEPALIVLDEPTASLDARAEHDVFERFAELARPTDGVKPVTVLVSHRFSTVRMADLIVVLHEGKIEEIGSHDELLAAGGRYAELFRMQASRYD